MIWFSDQPLVYTVHCTYTYVDLDSNAMWKLIKNIISLAYPSPSRNWRGLKPSNVYVGWFKLETPSASCVCGLF